MEIKIIYRSEVNCKKFCLHILLSVCRMCDMYRYETVDGKVICNYVPIKRDGIPRQVRP